jgi:preprotein translocase subunit YajC
VFFEMSQLLTILAVAQNGGQSNMIQTFIMIGLAILFFYFILWRPERKRRKALESLRTNLKPGDRVTAMGIVGTVDKIEDQTVVLKMVDGSKIEMVKAAISEIKAEKAAVVESSKK